MTFYGQHTYSKDDYCKSVSALEVRGLYRVFCKVRCPCERNDSISEMIIWNNNNYVNSIPICHCIECFLGIIHSHCPALRILRCFQPHLDSTMVATIQYRQREIGKRQKDSEQTMAWHEADPIAQCFWIYLCIWLEAYNLCTLPTTIVHHHRQNGSIHKF